MAFTRLLSLVQCLSLFLFVAAIPSSYETSLDARGNPAKKFSITLTWETADIVGATNPRNVILMNGTLPGPTLNLNVGDNVQFEVHNKLPFSTTIHFHGIEQKGTPWSDGVPGLSQAPIESGDSFLYEWNANEFGTYFYHAHRKGQIMDGLYGAIMIQPKSTESRPFKWISNGTNDVAKMVVAEANAIPMILADFTQFTSAEFFDIAKAGNIDQTCVDSLIINGKVRQMQYQDEDFTLTYSGLCLLSDPGRNQRYDGTSAWTDPRHPQPFNIDTEGMPPTRYHHD